MFFDHQIAIFDVSAGNSVARWWVRMPDGLGGVLFVPLPIEGKTQRNLPHPSLWGCSLVVK